MGANGKALGHALATATTVLGRIRGRDRFYSLASVHCFAREDRQKLAPANVMDRCIEARFVAGPVGQIRAVPVSLRLWAGAEVLALKSLVVDGVVLADQRVRRLMVEVAPLSRYLLMPSGKEFDGLAPAGAALLSARDTPLGTLERFFGLAIVARILDERAIRQRHK